MPELPEVETVARGVNDRIGGERIESAWFSSKPEPCKTPPAEMAEALAGKHIARVRRVGKTIVFDLSSADGPDIALQWLVHLGMTGRLLVSEASVELPRHTHGILHLSSGRELRFVDARRFGRMGLHWLAARPARINVELAGGAEGRIVAGPHAGTHTGAVASAAAGAFAGTGCEPLEISLDAFRALFRRSRTSIKAALLNQKLLHGVGNIYADESLFRAGIRPRRMAARLTRVEAGRLYASLRDVLTAAIALGGSSVSDYVDADGVRGFFQLEHRVYMRGGLPCLVCGTPIRRLVLAGRGTHYCPQCQR